MCAGHQPGTGLARWDFDAGYRSEFGAALLKGAIVVAGGFVFSTIAAFNPEIALWEQLPSLTRARRGESVVSQACHRFRVWGGGLAGRRVERVADVESMTVVRSRNEASGRFSTNCGLEYTIIVNACLK